MQTKIVTRYPPRIAQPGVDWANLTLGVGLAASPWIALGDSYVALLNAFVCGVIIVFAAGVSLTTPSVRALLTVMVVAAWLVIAPWLFGFADSPLDTSISVFIGLGTFGLASFKLSSMSRLRV